MPKKVKNQLYLQKPWLKPVIQQHVKAQDLKAGAASGVVGEAGVVVVLEDGGAGQRESWL